MFRSLIHFELIFLYGVRKCSSFILLQVVDQFSQHHFFFPLSEYFIFSFIYLFYFTILYWFCHTLTWICHGCTCVPHPEPPFNLPHHPIPLGHPSAPAPSILYHASNLDWRFISHVIIYMFQCHSPISSYPHPLLQSPKDCSIHLCLFCCLAYRVIITIFLNSIYMRWYTVLVFFFLAHFTCIIGSSFIHFIKTDSTVFFLMVE